MRTLSVAILLGVSIACGASPDCPTQSGYNSCGYCNQDRATSSNPHAGMCTYCQGACGADACSLTCGGGSSGSGSCDTSWVARCGTTSGGIQFIGQPYPKACGNCPAGTHDTGDDNVSAGGPYNLCTCNGF